MRAVALLVLLAVLPTAELAEQLVHVVEHLVHHDAPDHMAHHEHSDGDEHGCTGLVHLCGNHHTLVTAPGMLVTARAIRVHTPSTAEPPRSLVDLTSREPAQRPPIA